MIVMYDLRPLEQCKRADKASQEEDFPSETRLLSLTGDSTVCHSLLEWENLPLATSPS